MPFKWEKGKNPYTCNHFGNLQIGPNTPPTQIQAQATNLTQKLKSGKPVKCAAGHLLDEHTVNGAATRLRDPRSLAEELLLTHPQPPGEDRKRIKSLVEDLNKRASLSLERSPLPLRSPLAIFWFVPAPGLEAVQLPDWEAFGFVEPSDPEDLTLDIVFDS